MFIHKSRKNEKAKKSGTAEKGEKAEIDQTTERPVFSLQSYDAPVLSIGSPDYLLNFDNTMADCQGNKNGLFVNLHNNLWNTGFPIYYGQDAKFRFKLGFF